MGLGGRARGHRREWDLGRITGYDRQHGAGQCVAAGGGSSTQLEASGTCASRRAPLGFVHAKGTDSRREWGRAGQRRTGRTTRTHARGIKTTDKQGAPLVCPLPTWVPAPDSALPPDTEPPLSHRSGPGHSGHRRGSSAPPARRARTRQPTCPPPKDGRNLSVLSR